MKASTYADWPRWMLWGRFLKSWAIALAAESRYVVRSVLRERTYAIVTIASIAMGVGLYTAFLGMMRAALDAPLPYERPGELFLLSATTHRGATVWGTSLPNINDILSGTPAIARSAATTSTAGTMTLTDGSVVPVMATRATGRLFTVLGVKPLLGRVFDEADDDPAALPVVVLSHSLWRAQFGSSRDVIGRAVLIDSAVHTVIGVAPAGFDYPQSRLADLWTPLVLTRDAGWRRRSCCVSLLVRLPDRPSLETARAQLAATNGRLLAEHPRDLSGVAFALKPIREMYAERSGFTDITLVGNVLFGALLVLAASNVATLAVARALSRRQQVAVRLALGAPRLAPLRLTVIETLLLAAVGGSAGLTLAALLGSWLREHLLDGPASWFRPGVDLPTATYALALTAAASLIAGLGPTLLLARVPPALVLKEATAAATAPPGARRWRAVLLVIQVALVMCFLVVTVRKGRAAFNELRDLRASFPDSSVLVASVYNVRGSAPISNGSLRGAASSIAALPSVTAAAWAQVDLIPGAFVEAEGRRVDVDYAIVSAVSPQYFVALRTTPLRGRLFSMAESEAGLPVAVISESAARAFWGASSPLGRPLRIDSIGDTRTYQVVGVIEDARAPILTHMAGQPMIYLSGIQRSGWGGLFVVQHRSDPTTLSALVAARLRESLATAHVPRIRSVADISRSTLRLALVPFALLAPVAAAALAVAGVGIYGAIGYALRSRQRELAIRAAVGASPSQLALTVAGDLAKLTAIGIAIGAPIGCFLALSFASSPQRAAFDAGDLAAALGLVALTASVAGYRLLARLAVWGPAPVLRSE